MPSSPNIVTLTRLLLSLLLLRLLASGAWLCALRAKRVLFDVFFDKSTCEFDNQPDLEQQPRLPSFFPLCPKQTFSPRIVSLSARIGICFKLCLEG